MDEAPGCSLPPELIPVGLWGQAGMKEGSVGWVAPTLPPEIMRTPASDAPARGLIVSHV